MAQRLAPSATEVNPDGGPYWHRHLETYLLEWFTVWLAPVTFKGKAAGKTETTNLPNPGNAKTHPGTQFERKTNIHQRMRVGMKKNMKKRYPCSPRMTPNGAPDQTRKKTLDEISDSDPPPRHAPWERGGEKGKKNTDDRRRKGETERQREREREREKKKREGKTKWHR